MSSKLSQMFLSLAAWFKWLYLNHIQKLSAYILLAETLDSATIDLIASFFGPKHGPIVSRGIRATAGIMIAFRAHQVKYGPNKP